MQFLGAFDVEDAQVRPLPDDAPEMLPFAGTLELLCFLALFFAQIPNHVPVRGFGYDYIDLDLKNHVHTPRVGSLLLRRALTGSVAIAGQRGKLCGRLCPRRLPVESLKEHFSESMV